MDTKVRKQRTKLHTDIITLRIAPEIKQKFETLCNAEFKNASTVARDLIMEYVRNRQGALTIINQQPQQQKPQRTTEWDLRQPTSPRPPSAQQYHDTDWD